MAVTNSAEPATQGGPPPEDEDEEHHSNPTSPEKKRVIDDDDGPVAFPRPRAGHFPGQSFSLAALGVRLTGHAPAGRCPEIVHPPQGLESDRAAAASGWREAEPV